MRASVIAKCVALLPIAQSVSADVRYRATVLQHRTGTFPSAHPRALAENGQVAGVGYTSQLPQLACVWSESDEITILGDLPGGPQQSEARGINSSGFVTGYGALSDMIGQAFLYSPDVGFQALGSLSTTWPNSEGVDINESNHVTGTSSSPQGEQAFLWTPEAGMIGLGALPSVQFYSTAWALNNVGQVVGHSYSYLVRSGEAFVWDAENGMRPLGLLPNNSGFANYGADINDLGQVTGLGQLVSGGGEGFLWDPVEGYTLFGAPWEDFPFSVGVSINDHAVIVGAVGSTEWPYQYRAIVWDRVNGLRNLNELLDPCGAPGLDYLYSAIAINNRGQIACNGSPIVGGWLAVRLDPYLPGDLNEDDSVTLQDLANLLANFGRTGDANYAAGDLDCDADVDLEDLAILLGNFGGTLP